MRLISWLVALVLGLVLALFPQPAEAGTGCVISVAGVKVCGELLGQPLPEVVKVTVPGPTVRVTSTVKVQGPTVRIPGPTTTVPGGTKTVTVPGPTTFVTRPGETVTAPFDGSTPNVTPGPTATATVTSVPTPTRQDPTPSGRLDPNDDGSGILDFPDINSPKEALGLGLLSILVIALLTAGGMAYGFYRGRRSMMHEDTRFMRDLLDEAAIK
jgi:hypothetical protein